MLPVAVARSSSDGVAMRYVLPVLRMGRIKEDVMFRRSSPGGGTIPVGRQTTTAFSLVRQNVVPEAKSATYSR